MKTLPLWCLMFAWSCAAEPVTPPAQPATGPGGRDYKHASVRKRGPFGEGAKAFWLFEPEAPTPACGPVVAFLHGYTGVDAKVYGGWIEHLVRRGNVVIYPVYQDSLFSVASYTANALAAVNEAFRVLRFEPGHVRPDGHENFALVGHSLGCPIAANIAALAASEGLPTPKALMVCHAGDTNITKNMPPSLQPPANIPNLLMLVVVGADDRIVGDSTGRQIFFQSCQVKPQNKNLIFIQSDDHGRPSLETTHFAPLSLNENCATGARLGLGLRDADLPGMVRSRLTGKIRSGATMPASFGRTNALDFYGYWKWFDALMDAAFYGIHRSVALGGTNEQASMGAWSDGTPVTPAVIELAR